MTETPSDTPATDADAPAPETGQDQARPRGRWRWLGTATLVLLAVAAATAFGTYKWAVDLHEGAGPATADTIVLIPAGTGLRGIATRLERAGVIEQQDVFVAMARLKETHKTLKAGEYLFEAGVSQAAVLDKLIRNEVVERTITVPEGLIVPEVLEILANVEGLEAESLDAPPPEGSMLPETYRYRRGETMGDMVRRMQDAMKSVLAELWAARAEGLPFDSPEQAVVLASIVEKETGVAGERARIAGVFINRLRKPMRLQSDPTVAFALTDGKAPLDRALTRQDWKLDHPYNTYMIDGLPPGPIANPGRSALEAVLNPMDTRELYFVADGTGGHAFAETLKEHNRNVAKWRKFKASQQKD